MLCTRPRDSFPTLRRFYRPPVPLQPPSLPSLTISEPPPSLFYLDSENSTEDTMLASSITAPQFTQTDSPPEGFVSISVPSHRGHLGLFDILAVVPWVWRPSSWERMRSLTGQVRSAYGYISL